MWVLFVVMQGMAIEHSTYTNHSEAVLIRDEFIRLGYDAWLIESMA